jgi:hypothetical protein
MKEKNPTAGNRSLDLQTRIREQLQKFEELRGFL